MIYSLRSYGYIVQCTMKNINKKKIINSKKIANAQLDKHIKSHNKNVGKRKKIVLISLVFLILIFSLVIILEASVYIFNRRIYKTIKENMENVENSETIKIPYKYSKLLLWNKTVKYINGIDKEIEIIRDGYSIILNNGAIKRHINLDVAVEIVESELEEFMRTNVINVNVKNSASIQMIKSVLVDVDPKVIDSSYADVYTTNGVNYTRYLPAAEIKERKNKI